MLADPRQEVLAANRAFYEYFRLGDYISMDGLWSHTEDVQVCHPGAELIAGREDVMDTWYRILVMKDPPAIYPCCETVILNGSKAVVFCTEQIGTAELIGSNVFSYEGDGWRMTQHQATALPRRRSQR